MKISTIVVSIYLLGNFSGLFAQYSSPADNKETFNITEQKLKQLGPNGGDVQDLIADPNNNDIMYAGFNEIKREGYPKGIIYRTSDGGDTWTLFYELPNYMRFLTMEIDPNNSDILYVCSNREIYKTTDAGVSWTSSTILQDLDMNWFGIKVNKFNSNTVFGFSRLIFRLRLYKSTDRGENWNSLLILDGYSLHAKNTCLAFDETDFKKIYVATYARSGSQYIPYFIRSTDEGETWNDLDISSKITIGDYIRCIAVDNNGHLTLCSGGSGIYRSTDSGENWTLISSQPDNLISLKYLSDDPNILAGSGTDTVYVSTDGGSTWRSSYTGTSDYGEIDLLHLKSAEEFYIGNSVGIFKTTDEGITWDEKNSGLNPQKYIKAFDFSNENPDIIFAVPEDGIYKSTDRGAHWERVFFSSSITKLTVDEESPEIVYALEYDESSGSGNLYKTTDGGATFHTVPDFTGDLEVISSGSNVWITYFEKNTNRHKLKKSTDGGINWTETTIDQLKFSRISFLRDPVNDNILYIGGYADNLGYRRGIIYKSTDGGSNWNSIYDAGYGNEISSIFVDPSNTNNIYFNSVQGIFKSIDGGISWNNINSAYLNALYIDNSGVIYNAGEYVVMVSSDGGDSWDTYGYNDGMLSKVERNCIAFDETNKILYVGTQEWGILSMNFAETTKIKAEDKKLINSHRLFSNYPNPFNQQTAVRFQVLGVRDQGLGIGHVKLEIYNILGQLVTTLVNEERQPGEHTVYWNGKDMHGRDVPSGVYFYRMKAGEFTDVKKMILMK